MSDLNLEWNLIRKICIDSGFSEFSSKKNFCYRTRSVESYANNKYFSEFQKKRQDSYIFLDELLNQGIFKAI